jgi:hypothetical protein
MVKAFSDPEIIWENLLSGEENLVGEIFESLDFSERGAVLEHLKRMVNEPGWQPSQQLAAQKALSILDEKGLID